MRQKIKCPHCGSEKCCMIDHEPLSTAMSVVNKEGADWIKELQYDNELYSIFKCDDCNKKFDIRFIITPEQPKSDTTKQPLEDSKEVTVRKFSVSVRPVERYSDPRELHIDLDADWVNPGTF